MTSFRDAVRPQRAPTPEEDEVIQQVRALAVEWDAGRLPLSQCRQHSTGSKRWLTTRFTPPDDPSFGPLMRMLDALIATAQTDEGNLIKTSHGYLSQKDLVGAESKIEREDGRERLVLPVRYPWIRKPDPEKGTEGIRGPAVYRSREERKPVYGSFRAKPEPVRPEPTVPWWDGTDDDEGQGTGLVAVGQNGRVETTAPERERDPWEE